MTDLDCNPSSWPEVMSWDDVIDTACALSAGTVHPYAGAKRIWTFASTHREWFEPLAGFIGYASAWDETIDPLEKKAAEAAILEEARRLIATVN